MKNWLSEGGTSMKKLTTREWIEACKERAGKKIKKNSFNIERDFYELILAWKKKIAVAIQIRIQ
jgi:hypothetical protein